jgi:NAD-dependent dihydropyrimidine dehydrogenase PreA subunit
MAARLSSETHWRDVVKFIRCTWQQAVARGSESRGSAKAVLCTLALCCTKDGRVAAPVPAIAVLCGLCEAQVKRGIKALLNLGDIKLIRKGGGKSNPSEYQILVSRSALWRNPSVARYCVSTCPNHSVSPGDCLETRTTVARARIEHTTTESVEIPYLGSTPNGHPADEHSPFCEEQPAEYKLRVL